MRIAGLIATMAVSAFAASAGNTGSAQITVLSYDDLDGWKADDHGEALAVFVATCRLLDDPQWRPICDLAADQDEDKARTFFELFFRPVLIEDGSPPLFTAYYEPIIRGSRVETPRFRWPVYAKPPDLPGSGRYYTRAQIERDGALRGRGLEIAWVDDPVALQFLQIQGSGRIRLTDGSTIRLGYAGSNGHTFRSLGRELVRRGIYNRHQVSQPVISNWVRRNPEDGVSLLWNNPSYVFFRVLGRDHGAKGPLGAMNRPITSERTLAVDPSHTPLGAPVWLEKDGETPIRRLMVAQDTGSRIKGAQRADIFFGTGDEAGKRAGRIHDGGRMVVLMPIQHAFFLALDDEP